MTPSQRDTDQLTALVTRWNQARPLTPILRPEPVLVSPALLETVTRDPDQRAAVLQDASQWLRFGRPVGLGLMYTIEAPKLSLDTRGRRVIRPLRYQASWSNVMSALDPVYTENHICEQWCSVVWEAGAWKLAAIWDEAQRSSVLQSLVLFQR